MRRPQSGLSSLGSHARQFLSRLTACSSNPGMHDTDMLATKNLVLRCLRRICIIHWLIPCKKHCHHGATFCTTAQPCVSNSHPPHTGLQEAAGKSGKRQKLSCACSRIWGFPKIRGTSLGVPIIGIIVYWGLYWGSLI